jgi:hypothetical protein
MLRLGRNSLSFSDLLFARIARSAARLLSVSSLFFLHSDINQGTKSCENS